MVKTNIGPKVSDAALLFLERHFSTRNQGAEYVLEAFPVLFRRALAGLKGRFSAGELSLMIDVSNATMLTPAFAGDTLRGDCADGIALDGLDDKWSVDKADFLPRLDALSPFDAACLELWAHAFWYGSQAGADVELAEYVDTLT